ncbi:c-type cytochrome [Roseateles cellulosilyticus]|uniref:C-type cytochrome n=1 Tax=Pelomonas cellulosilytica TaxID=2906762 RepID=A0ABS8Y357_9BURK|nr:c-type cytochrome [Pelomonas sp. P8]MCE4557503.1 c-type cytochrome [Pelomonas sp. P8]
MKVAVAALLGLVAPGLAGAAADVAAGRKLFASCANCHAVGPGARHGFGPQLNGLAGRRAGSVADYAYSPAMKASGLVWNEATLTAFLRDPNTVVPGTKMRYWGLGINEAKVADLLAYLAATQPR